MDCIIYDPCEQEAVDLSALVKTCSLKVNVAVKRPVFDLEKIKNLEMLPLRTQTSFLTKRFGPQKDVVLDPNSHLLVKLRIEKTGRAERALVREVQTDEEVARFFCQNERPSSRTSEQHGQMVQRLNGKRTASLQGRIAQQRLRSSALESGSLEGEADTDRQQRRSGLKDSAVLYRSASVTNVGDLQRQQRRPETELLQMSPKRKKHFSQDTRNLNNNVGMTSIIPGEIRRDEQSRRDPRNSRQFCASIRDESVNSDQHDTSRYSSCNTSDTVVDQKSAEQSRSSRAIDKQHYKSRHSKLLDENSMLYREGLTLLDRALYSKSRYITKNNQLPVMSTQIRRQNELSLVEADLSPRTNRVSAEMRLTAGSKREEALFHGSLLINFSADVCPPRIIPMNTRIISASLESDVKLVSDPRTVSTNFHCRLVDLPVPLFCKNVSFNPNQGKQYVVDGLSEMSVDSIGANDPLLFCMDNTEASCKAVTSLLTCADRLHHARMNHHVEVSQPDDCQDDKFAVDDKRTREEALLRTLMEFGVDPNIERMNQVVQEIISKLTDNLLLPDLSKLKDNDFFPVLSRVDGEPKNNVVRSEEQDDEEMHAGSSVATQDEPRSAGVGTDVVDHSVRGTALRVVDSSLSAVAAAAAGKNMLECIDSVLSLEDSDITEIFQTTSTEALMNSGLPGVGTRARGQCRGTAGDGGTGVVRSDLLDQSVYFDVVERISSSVDEWRFEDKHLLVESDKITCESKCRANVRGVAITSSKATCTTSVAAKDSRSVLKESEALLHVEDLCGIKSGQGLEQCEIETNHFEKQLDRGRQCGEIPVPVSGLAALDEYVSDDVDTPIVWKRPRIRKLSLRKRSSPRERHTSKEEHKAKRLVKKVIRYLNRALEARDLAEVNVIIVSLRKHCVDYLESTGEDVCHLDYAGERGMIP